VPISEEEQHHNEVLLTEHKKKLSLLKAKMKAKKESNRFNAAI